jgi:hypothetical protein
MGRGYDWMRADVYEQGQKYGTFFVAFRFLSSCEHLKQWPSSSLSPTGGRMSTRTVGCRINSPQGNANIISCCISLPSFNLSSPRGKDKSVLE